MTPIPTSQASPDAQALAKYASYLWQQRLDDVAAVNHENIMALDLPVMRLFADQPEEVLRASNRQGLEKLLDDLAEGAVRVEVQDSGTALLVSDQDRVFERFTQPEGTWLGLSVSRALVEAHGGKIGVRSAPGEGNTFWFTIPVDPAEPEA